MQLVPLNAVPNQTLTVTLGQQIVRVNVYQKLYGLFVDVFVGDSPIILGVIAQNRNRIVRYKYLGFSGDFVFVDAKGSTDPVWTGLGDRYEFLYLDAEDLDQLGLAA